MHKKKPDMGNPGILFITALNFWSISQGKGAPSFYNTVNGYVKDGWDVHVIMTVEKPNFGSNPENLHLYNCGFKALKRMISIRHFSVPVRFVTWVLSNIYYAIQGKRIIGEHSIDIVYAYEVEGVPAARFLSNRHHKPLVTRFMGTVLAGKTKLLKTRISLWYHFAALKCKADLVIMTNDGTQGDKVLQILGNKSRDIRFWMNGIDRVDLLAAQPDQLRKRYQLSDHCRILLCVSRLVAWKRLDRSIHVLKAMLDSGFSDVRLIIVGEGNAKQELQTLTDDLGISDKVVFAGGLPQSEIYQHMMLADVFLSLYDLSNMGNPLFEAMRCGRPIVTLDNGDTATVIKTGINGILLENDDVNNIAAAILQLLNDKEIAAQLGRNALQFAEENFRTWEQRISDELAVVKGLIPFKGQ